MNESLEYVPLRNKEYSTL